MSVFQTVKAQAVFPHKLFKLLIFLFFETITFMQLMLFVAVFTDLLTWLKMNWVLVEHMWALLGAVKLDKSPVASVFGSLSGSLYLFLLIVVTSYVKVFESVLLDQCAI